MRVCISSCTPQPIQLCTCRIDEKDRHTDTGTEKLGSGGPHTLEEQQPGTSAFINTSAWRRQIYCIQLKKEAGLAYLGWRSL